MNTTTKTETAYIVTADGLRMSYQEWLEMKKAERN